MVEQSSCTDTALTHEVEVMDERGRISTILVPAERALTVYLNDFELVTLMTLGATPYALTLGYLRNQRLVSSPNDVIVMHLDWDSGTIRVKTKGKVLDLEERTSRRVITTGCGQGTSYGGLLDDLEDVRLDPNSEVRKTVVYSLVDQIRKQPSIYKTARSVHACALFSATGHLQYFVEDVGRHNAVDSIAGLMWKEGLDGTNFLFYTTGRLTSEMVIKSAQIGIPCMLSRSGTTEMGRQIATRVGMTLMTRCTGRHFMAVTCADRLVWDADMYMDGDLTA